MCLQKRKWICGCRAPPAYLECNKPNCKKRLPFQSSESTHTIDKICLRGDPAQFERRANVRGDSIQDELDAAGWTVEAIRHRAEQAFQVALERFGTVLKGVQHADAISVAMLNGEDEGECEQFARFPTDTVGTFGSGYVSQENVQEQADNYLATWAWEWYLRVGQAEPLAKSTGQDRETVRYQSIADARRRADTTTFKQWVFCQALAILETHGEDTQPARTKPVPT